ncbi:enoyl-CoA hydratase/isomerase family protein [Bosea sp. 2KB_26]|uniref:enoyl-CoA hydratase/isomerase family protein n=1 Tax=Bosea sp. 2KB_26 TaxID=3237475 RepID=UPI003F9140CF
MSDTILSSVSDGVGLIMLNRPQVLNAWDGPMRAALVEKLRAFECDESVRSIVITGAGERAFSAGQDLNETKRFSGDDGKAWIAEWEVLYGLVRSLTKPFIAALNGVAAGSAFQFSLLTDIRIAHSGVKMGQPEINSGIASTLGPWIMREMIGLSRTIELTLTGRMMSAEECLRIGLISELVEQERVLPRALELAQELARKPPVAMRLNKARFREVTEAGFVNALRAGEVMQKESYGSGEPARMMEAFFRQRAGQK